MRPTASIQWKLISAERITEKWGIQSRRRHQRVPFDYATLRWLVLFFVCFFEWQCFFERFYFSHELKQKRSSTVRFAPFRCIRLMRSRRAGVSIVFAHLNSIRLLRVLLLLLNNIWQCVRWEREASAVLAAAFWRASFEFLRNIRSHHFKERLRLSKIRPYFCISHYWTISSDC